MPAHKSTGKPAKAAPHKAAPHKAATAKAAPHKAATHKAARPRAKIVRDLSRPEFYVNRELSWLEFNERVLEEARDASNPLLERLKFLTIVSSNLDEFFEVRVAALQQSVETQSGSPGPDGMSAAQTLEAIAGRVRRMVREQYGCYRDEIVPGLAAHGVDLFTIADLDEAGRAWSIAYFEREVSPVLTPLAIDPAHPFPQFLNKSLNLAVVLEMTAPAEASFDNGHAVYAHDAPRFGVVQVPRVLPRLVALPAELCPPGRQVYVFLSSIISQYIGRLFPGLQVTGCYAFRLTRNSELYLDEDEADNLLEEVQQQLQRRRRGDAVRLEVQRGCDPAVVEMLLHTFELESIDLYEVDGPVNLTRLMAVYQAEKRPELKDPPFKPSTPRVLRGLESPDELFAAIRREDILLHHPFESFQSVVDFVEMAAADPHVLAIKQTLYRTSANSPIVGALIRAAQNGKQVTALVELKARFDEENNIQRARAMEEAGVHVLYGLVGLKTHCKMALVVRHEEHGVARYVHIGTGNYNEITAHFYTDVGLLTANPAIGEDAAKIFNLLTGMGRFPGLDKLMMAPFGLDAQFTRLIEREAAHARRTKPKTKPRIIIKMNSLVDPTIIEALYRASQAGVQIDLIVRGVCCLRPGVPGVSDNIRVRSIIDRFLEHSRVFYFANNGAEEIYIGSADWMPRNFHRRVEVICPVADPALRRVLRDDLLLPALKDNVKARRMNADGCYSRPRRSAREAPLRLQQWLLEGAALHAEHAPDFLKNRPAAAPSLSTVGRPLELTLRAAPQPLAPHSNEGRAGTSADPILQSLAAGIAESSELPVPSSEPHSTLHSAPDSASDEAEPESRKAKSSGAKVAAPKRRPKKS